MFQNISTGRQSYHRLPQSIRSLFVFGVMIVAMIGVIGVTYATHAATTTCPANDMQYRVTSGDSLDTIAERFGTTYQVLAKESQIALPRLIFPGQLVCIPPSAIKRVVDMPITGMPTTIPMPLLPNNPFVAIARLDAADANIPVQLFLNQIFQESGFQAFDVNGKPLTSVAGAIGIAQFEPGTAAGLGIDPTNPSQSLKGAAQLMARYIMMEGGNLDVALSDYNAGPGTTAAAVQRCGAARVRGCLPTETQQYIHVITGN